MKTSSLKAGLFLCLCVFLLALCLPSLADAQYSRRSSSQYRSKINDLDDDIVKKLPIPILFGVTLRSITSNFGDERDGGERTHEGLDIMAIEGAPIISPTDAVVIRTGSGSSSGKYVTTANPGGETMVYMHLSEILVDQGDELNQGDIIGYVGNTGNASGGPPHLHYEIRDGGEALDPYPRISVEFSLEEKIDFLDKALRTVDDEDDLVDFVIENYQREMQQAEIAGIELPEDIAKELVVLPAPVPSSSATDDLQLGSRGPGVVYLQNFLIEEKTGLAAEALGEAGATGYFGSITQRALIEYQTAHGITPSVGYYGPKTRAYILAN